MTLTRQQKRKALRDAEKDLKKIIKIDEYKAMRKYFDLLSKEDYELLSKGEHTDPVAVMKFKRFSDDVKTFCEIESRVEYYKGLLGLLPIQKEN